MISRREFLTISTSFGLGTAAGAWAEWLALSVDKERMSKGQKPIFHLNADYFPLTATPAASATSTPMAAVTEAIQTQKASTPYSQLFNWDEVSLAVHMGMMSIDRGEPGDELTQSETDAAVEAIKNHLPQVDFITIGTYLDYPEQIRRWANSTHENRLKLELRSAGFNSWQGTNGEAPTGNPQQHLQGMLNLINENPKIFRNGDVV